MACFPLIPLAHPLIQLADMGRNLLTAIDIGSSQIRIATAEVTRENKIKILALAKVESHGVRFGHLVSQKDAQVALSEGIRKIENSIGMKIKRATLSVNGIALDTTVLASSIAISRADGEVTDLDVERALNECESKIAEQANARIVHSIPIDFKVDGKKILGKPQGMHAGKLEVKTLFITALNSHLQKLVKLVESVGIEVEDIFAGPIAESIVTTTNLQKNAGCAVVNIGASTTSVIVYEENLPRALSVFKIGGDDITNDIALGMKVTIEEAENLKIGGTNASGNQKLPPKKIQDITEARLKDIFELVDGSLKKIGRSELLPAGVVITGGGSNIERITEYAKRHLNLPASIGRGTDKKLLSPTQSEDASQKEIMQARVNFDAIRDPFWANAYGILVLSSQLEGETTPWFKPIKKTKDQILGWFKQFLP